MKVKVIVAVATAVCLGALSVVVFTRTSVHVEAPASRTTATALPNNVDATANKKLHELFSGATPDPKLAP